MAAPSGESFGVDISAYEGIEVERIAREETFKAAVRTQNQWRENLDKGKGALGRHGRYRESGTSDTQFRNTGEAVNDITVTPAEPSLEHFVGGDVIQLAIAEFGRVPSPNSPPPYQAIADWAREKGLQPDQGETFEEMVDAIRWAIADRGIPGFAPARLAAQQVGPEFEENTIRRLNEEIGEQSGD